MILIHFVSEWLIKKVKGCRRPRPPTTAVLFTKRRGQTKNDEESESEETCALLVREGGVVSSEESHVTSYPTESRTNNHCDYDICREDDHMISRQEEGNRHTSRGIIYNVTDNIPNHQDVRNTTEITDITNMTHQTAPTHTLVTINEDLNTMSTDSRDKQDVMTSSVVGENYEIPLTDLNGKQLSNGIQFSNDTNLLTTLITATDDNTSLDTLSDESSRNPSSIGSYVAVQGEGNTPVQSSESVSAHD